MKKKLLTLGLAMSFACLGFAGCSSDDATVSETETPTTITLTDNAGREVELPYPVETAVVANRYNSELIRACGAIDNVIAVDMNTAQDRVYWGIFDTEDVIGTSQTSLDYEKIVELNPQVLILPANGSVEEAEATLAPFGIEVFVISGYDTDDFVNQCENIGIMFDVEERADEFCTYFTDLLDYIDVQLADVEPLTYYGESNNALSAILPSNTFATMFELAHVENIFGDDVSLTDGEISSEEVIARNPDVIFKVITAETALSGTGVYFPPDEEQFIREYEDMLARDAWGEITAIADEEIYFMTQFSHGGAGKLVGTMFIAESVYGEYLPELDAEQVFYDWLVEWQGFDFVDGHFYTPEDFS